jgi:hypothetical protein
MKVKKTVNAMKAYAGLQVQLHSFHRRHWNEMHRQILVHPLYHVQKIDWYAMNRRLL